LSHPFLLTFLGRSGSTALMYDLAQHPKAIVHMEIFGEPTLPGDLPQTDENRLAFLRQLWAGYRNPELMPKRMKGCARGFKLQFTRAKPQFERPARLAKLIEAYGVLVFALHRRDLLRKAISSLRGLRLAAVNQQEWGHFDPHIKPESGPLAHGFANQPIHVDVSELEDQLQRVALNQRDMDRFLARCPPALSLTYEDYLADRLGTLNRILEVLELEPFAEAPPPRLVKATDDDLSKAVSNYEELCAFAKARGLPL
jgi:hypothetical protein